VSKRTLEDQNEKQTFKKNKCASRSGRRHGARCKRTFKQSQRFLACCNDEQRVAAAAAAAGIAVRSGEIANSNFANGSHDVVGLVQCHGCALLFLLSSFSGLDNDSQRRLPRVQLYSNSKRVSMSAILGSVKSLHVQLWCRNLSHVRFFFFFFSCPRCCSNLPAHLITYSDISGLNLTGSIPASIARLTKLTMLYACFLLRVTFFFSVCLNSPPVQQSERQPTHGTCAVPIVHDVESSISVRLRKLFLSPILKFFFSKRSVQQSSHWRFSGCHSIVEVGSTVRLTINDLRLLQLERFLTLSFPAMCDKTFSQEGHPNCRTRAL
jgi:hypothetical protein